MTTSEFIQLADLLREGGYVCQGFVTTYHPPEWSESLSRKNETVQDSSVASKSKSMIGFSRKKQAVKEHVRIAEGGGRWWEITSSNDGFLARDITPKTDDQSV